MFSLKRLPAGLSDPRHFTVQGELPETDSAKPKSPDVAVRTATAPTSPDGLGGKLRFLLGFDN